MNYFRYTFILTLIAAATLSRFLPHPVNFTPIVAIGLFSGAYFSHKKAFSFLIVLISMLLSDAVLGFHETMLFVYPALGFSTWIGQTLDIRSPHKRLPLYTVGSSLLFFIISNFGFWMTTNFYPKNLSGLQLCYLKAIPFLQNQIFGDLFFTATLFLTFEMSKRYVTPFRYA